jgi:RNA polymerase sigma factor (sigma-70 family)
MTQPPDQAAPPRDARPDAPADRHLLERFLEQGDDAAFAQLVERHGPMVRATSRRCLGDTLDADEVFQATFVILARKAATVRAELLGPWLHRVAVNAAHRAAAQARRRRTVERQVASMPEPAPRPTAVPPEWLGLFHEELERLPERYRAALVLCELQGQGRAEAALALGVPEGTLSSRLARGRVLLRRRLMRRGVVVTAVALGVVLAEDARAEVPPDLVRVTVRAATAGAMSAPVAALIEGVLRTMFLNKVKTWAIVCALAVGLTGAAVPLVLLAAEEKKSD